MSKQLSLDDSVDLLSDMLTNSSSSKEFDEEPVDLDTFLYDSDYLGSPPLSKTQYEYVEALSDIYKGCK